MSEKENDQVEIHLEEENKPVENADIVIEDADSTEDTQKQEIKAEDGVEELKRRLEAEKLARMEAEKRANAAAEQARRASLEVEDTNLHLVNSAIDTVKNDNAMLKSHYREAMQLGDYERAAEIQEAMANNSAKLLQLENGRQAMQSKPRMEQEAPSYADPVEAFARTLSPRSADWVRRNPQCVTNPRMRQKMEASHFMAMADGYIPDTDDYFNHVESLMGLNAAKAPAQPSSVEQPLSAASAPTQRRSSPAAAPVSRSGTGTGDRPNVVRLTAAEREMASMMGMSEQEYAKNKRLLQKEGKL